MIFNHYILYTKIIFVLILKEVECKTVKKDALKPKSSIRYTNRRHGSDMFSADPVNWQHWTLPTSSMYSAIYQTRSFWCELPIFGDISCRDCCLLSNIMGLNCALNVVLTLPKIHLKNSTAVSLSRNHDPITQNNPQTLLGAVSRRYESSSSKLKK